MELPISLQQLLQNFETSGTIFAAGKRNTIKTFPYNGEIISVKSFRVPDIFNKVIYRFFRKSKAKRSYEFATILSTHGIGTPRPIAYQENFDWLGLTTSYYVCEHIEDVITFREIIHNEDYPDRDTIIAEFSRFCYLLHQSGVEFLDHSPGNTLIKKEVNASHYSFYLVDLNRMKFHDKLSFEDSMNNLSRITATHSIVEKMSFAYAEVSGLDYDLVYKTFWTNVSNFQKNVKRKKQIKQFFGI